MVNKKWPKGAEQPRSQGIHSSPVGAKYPGMDL